MLDMARRRHLEDLLMVCVIRSLTSCAEATRELEQDIAAKSDLLRSHKMPQMAASLHLPRSSSYYVYGNDTAKKSNGHSLHHSGSNGSSGSSASQHELESKLADMTRAYRNPYRNNEPLNRT